MKGYIAGCILTTWWSRIIFGHLWRKLKIDMLTIQTPSEVLSYGLPTTIIASEDRRVFVKRGDLRRGVVCLAGDDRR